MNKQQLASKIWESANKMRSKIEANDYKDYILGFIFYKFLSEQEEKFCRGEGYTVEDMKSLSESDTDTVKFIQKKIGYFISYDDLFSTWINSGKDFGIDNVRDALSAFDRLVNETHSRVFDGIFETLQTGLSKLGESASAQTKAARDLIHLINDIPMDGRQNYDVLGFIYEYLISNFAANAGKKAGEFYTPHEVSLLMSEIIANHLKDKAEIKIYDPTSGSGSLLINIGKAVARRSNSENGIKYYAQELKQNTYNLTRMNLVMRGILPDNIVTRNGDTLEDDWPYFEENDPAGTYDPLYVDAVVSNPPYSQKWDPSNKDVDPRFMYGLAPKSKADYAFLLQDLYHLRPEGIMTIVLPHGVLFRGGEEGGIRKNLIEHGHIEAIIGLPANIFFGTSIPTIIMVLRQKRAANDVLIIDASKGFIKEGKQNKLRACDIKKITDAVISREDIDKFCRVVGIEEIRKNDYNLNIPRYVDSSEPAESWDIYSTMFGGIPIEEIDALDSYWSVWPNLREALFEENGTPYAQPKTEAARELIMNQSDIVLFQDEFRTSFLGFRELLVQKLLSNPEGVNIAEEELLISSEIFARMDNIRLVDRYAAYQALDDSWQQTAIDLEIIQTEGFCAATKVDPKMVIKKEKEVQDGWTGHIIPFELVQRTILKDQADILMDKNRQLDDIHSRLDDILESINDEKDEVTNAEGNAFVVEKVKECARTAKKEGYEKDSYEAYIVEADELFVREKRLKAEIKTESASLHELTKKTIESLTTDQTKELLQRKWVDPICLALDGLPTAVVDSFTTRVIALTKKYEVTFSDIESDIREVEASLSSMIDELTGDEFDMKGLAEFQSVLGGEKRD